MDSNNKTWREQTATIPGKTNRDILFDTRPNHFVILNHGSAPIYIGLTYAPTASHYDAKIEPHQQRPIARLNANDRLMIYNDGTAKADVQIISFYQMPLDAAFFTSNGMTASEMEQVIGGTQSETVVSGFSAPLPAGTEHLGSVSIDGQPVEVSGEVAVKPGSGTIPVSVQNTNAAPVPVAVQNALTIAEMPAVEIDMSGATLATSQEWDALTGYWYQAGTTTETYYPATALKKLIFFANDGESDLTVAFNTGGTAITVKAGEVLEDLPLPISAIIVTGSSAYRIMGVY